jgi:hypothetical protein
VALGHDPSYVMGQMGHTSPTITLGLYSKPVRPEDRDRLRALADGQELALIGTGSNSAGSSADDATQVDNTVNGSAEPIKR